MDYAPQQMQQMGYPFAQSNAYMPQYMGYPPQQAGGLPYPEYMPQPAPQMGYAPQYGNPWAAPQPAAPSGYWDAGAIDIASSDADTLFDQFFGGQAAQVPPPAYGDDEIVVEEAAPGKEKPKKILRAVSDILFWAVCIALVVGSVLFALSKDPRKSYFGYRLYSVKTQSMTPKADGSSPPGGFGKGALILVKMSRPDEIKVNDIITFNPSVREEDNTLFLTHRVVDIKTELGGKEGIYFVTRGDFNNADDPPISADMLIGKKVFSVPGVGTFLQKARENFVLALVTILCLFACIFMFRWYFSGPKNPKKSVP